MLAPLRLAVLTWSGGVRSELAPDPCALLETAAQGGGRGWALKSDTRQMRRPRDDCVQYDLYCKVPWRVSSGIADLFNAASQCSEGDGQARPPAHAWVVIISLFAWSRLLLTSENALS